MKISRVFPWLLVGGLAMLGAPMGVRAEAPAVAAAKANGYTITLDIKIDEKGEPEDIAIAGTDDTSAGDVLLKMAIAMAAKTKFPPYLKDGKPAKHTVRAPFFFPIEGDEGPESDLAPKPRVKYGTAVQPVYPLELRDAGVTGGAILELNIDEKGTLTSVTCLRASHPQFETSAMDSIKKWQFTPAQKDGKPVASRTRFAFVFDTEQQMADLKWRIAPRPRLGSLIIIKPTNPIPVEEPAAAPAAGAQPAAPAPTGQSAPAPTPAPAK
jgi:TonB family protein